MDDYLPCYHKYVFVIKRKGDATKKTLSSILK